MDDPSRFERDEPAPQAGDYLRSQSRGWRGPGLPLAGFALLGIITVTAYIIKGPAVTPVEVDPGSELGAPSGTATMPVSASFDEAMASIEEALEADPADTLALAALIELTMSSHQLERAISLTDDWLAISPDHPEALLRKVMALASLERWEEALVVNHQLFVLDRARLLPRLNMGSIYGNLGQVEEARRWWTEVIEEAPGTAEAAAAERALAQLSELGDGD